MRPPLWKLAALLASATLASFRACAEPAPLTTPTRDVDIIYTIAGPTKPLEQRLRWGISLGKLRVDPPSPGFFLVIDTQSHLMQAVREGNRTVVEVKGGEHILPGPRPEGVFKRGESAKIAGLDCTQWQTHDISGQDVTICLTADGVLLRAAAEDHVLLLAQSVQFAPQSAEVFRIPADYQKITQPQPNGKPN